MKIMVGRASVWRTEVTQVLGLLLFVGIIELIVYAVDPRLDGVALVLASVVLAIVPAVLWLFFFYTQDRREPEPKQFVVGVAALAGLLASAVGQPLLKGIFEVPSWIGHDTLTQVLGSILVVGSVQEFMKYLAVRLSVFYSREFNQRMDGVVYGSAAGLGYATVLNIDAVIASGGVDLGVGVIRIVVNQLVYGSLGALVGYFLGRDKFDRKRVWWMPLGIAIAATINGLFSWLSGEITRQTLLFSSPGVVTAGYNPWPALALGTALAALVLAAIFFLIRADLRADAAGPVEAAGPSSGSGRLATGTETL